jgi:hypothetical protein
MNATTLRARRMAPQRQVTVYTSPNGTPIPDYNPMTVAEHRAWDEYYHSLDREGQVAQLRIDRHKIMPLLDELESMATDDVLAIKAAMLVIAELMERLENAAGVVDLLLLRHNALCDIENYKE